MLRRSLFVLALAAVAALSCTARHRTPQTYSAAVGAPACDARADRQVQPYVVDWTPEERQDIEQAVGQSRRGAVVAYDCTRAARVLPDCHFGDPGGYNFTGMETKRDSVVISGGDEVRATLPAHGTQLTADYGDQATFVADITRVGRLAIPVDDKGWGGIYETRPGACLGATHVVLGATLGASVLHASNAQMGGLSAGVVAGQAYQNHAVGSAQGDPAACGPSSTNAVSPPAGCRSLVRLVLAVIDGKPWPTSVDGPTCAYGLVQATSGSCIVPRESTRHVCRYENIRDCVNQCMQYEPSSCNSLGYRYEVGDGVSRDEVRARLFYQTACALKHAKACTNLAKLQLRYIDKSNPDAKASLELLQFACSEEDTRACTEQAKYLPDDPIVATASAFVGRGVIPNLTPARLELLRRGCRGGDAQACSQLGPLR